MMWLEDMASIFVTPCLLIFVVPKRVDDILQFIADFTVNVEGVGHVCSFSVFDFKDHGNSNYGSPCNSERSKRSSQGKMEKSFLSFQSNHLYWQPDPQGMQFLSTLKNFRDQQLRGMVTGNPYSTPTMWQWSLNLRDQRMRNTHVSRDSQIPPPFNHRAPRYHMGSMWLIEMDPRNHPYLLDWYYTSRPRLDSAMSFDSVRVDIPTPFHKNEERDEEAVGADLFEARSSTYLEASTSGSNFFREQSMRGNLKDSHWYARNSSFGFREPDPLSSFINPPEFNRHHSTEDHHETHSHLDLLEEEEDQENYQLDWRNYHSLSRTTNSDMLGSAGEFKLHFDDIYKTT